MLGARLDPLPSATVLTRSAKQAAKEIMMAVLFGMDRSCPSPCTATRSTLRAADKPAARKKCRAPRGAVLWLMMLEYMDRRVWDARMSTYGGSENSIRSTVNSLFFKIVLRETYALGLLFERAKYDTIFQKIS